MRIQEKLREYLKNRLVRLLLFGNPNPTLRETIEASWSAVAWSYRICNIGWIIASGTVVIGLIELL